jgi:hypothetical protein
VTVNSEKTNRESNPANFPFGQEENETVPKENRD